MYVCSCSIIWSELFYMATLKTCIPSDSCQFLLPFYLPNERRFKMDDLE